MQYSALAASLAPGMEKEEAYIELLDAAQAYLAAQARLQRSTTQGLLNITYARYASSGASHAPGALVSSAQYNTADMEATTWVSVSPQSGSELGKVQLHSACHQGSREGGAGAACSPAVSSSSKINDPCRWFGALIPPALRSAQSDFSAALWAAIDVINARQRLQLALAHFDQQCLP